MPGPPVSIGCAVVLSPGRGGAARQRRHRRRPAGGGDRRAGMPLATVGLDLPDGQLASRASPYPLPIGTAGALDRRDGRRPGARPHRRPDPLRARACSTILGPPAAPFVSDGNEPCQSALTAAELDRR